MDQLDLSTLIDHEPPLELTADRVLSRVRQRRARRVTGFAAASVAVAAITVTAGSHQLWRSSSDSVRAGAAPVSTVVEHPLGGPRSQQVQQAVVASSPVGWSYDFLQGTTPHDDGIDGTVDDGNGKSRVYVTVVHEAGNLTPKPCEDAEFVGTGQCTETALGDGRTLILRTPSRSAGLVTVVAGVLHADGTGIYAEAANAWWPHVDTLTSGERLSAEQRAALMQPEITRAAPVYTLTQLRRVVEAVDAAVLGG